MATQIVISNEDYIKLDDTYIIPWTDKGKNMVAIPNTIHYIVYGQEGPKEVQNKDASTGSMTGNTPMADDSHIITGSTSIADLLIWGEERMNQILQAKSEYRVAEDADIANGTLLNESKTWIDFDPNYS